jgi:hypothetical protein
MLDKIALKIAKRFDTTFTQGIYIAKIALSAAVFFVLGATVMLLIIGNVKYDTFEKYFIVKYETELRRFAKGEIDSVRIGQGIVQRVDAKMITVNIINTKFTIVGAGDTTKQGKGKGGVN